MHPSLRQYLRENVAPSEVWAALKLAMEGQNESARVAASRVLMDALHEPQQESTRDHQAELKAASDKFDRWLPRVVEAVIRALFTTGEPGKNDPMIVAHTLERVQADARLMRFVARLVEQRSVEAEIEDRVTALTADLEREELAAERADLRGVRMGLGQALLSRFSHWD